ncbi:DedA family protein [Vulcanococcus limneticus]|uniref:DedA family protein n=1 Tax=Vulcanococcus limneticus TaxID=2170428 RepID=UPI00398C248F
MALSGAHALLASVDGFSTADLQALVGRWGYLVVFLGMLLENAGLPLPGETLTLLGGYAAGSGQLNLFGVMAAAAGGAVLGDNLGYWVGRRAGWGLLLRVGRWLGQGPEQMERLRSGFLRRAGLSVLLGRFVAVLRVLAGPMAGAVGMPYRRFVLCNLAGAVLWSASMVSLAWLGGRWIPIERMLSGVIQFGLGALLLLAVVVLLPRLLSTWEGRLLERSEQAGPPDGGGDAGPGASLNNDQPRHP